MAEEKEYSVRVRGTPVTVTQNVYQTCHQTKRYAKTLYEKDARHNLVSYDGMDTENKVRNHGEREQYYVEGTHPPIIDRETFLAAQELRNSRKENRKICQRQEDPLDQKIACGVCGAFYRRKACSGKTFWVCRSHDRSSNSCRSGRIPEDEIHAAFLRLYHKLRLHDKPILKQMITDLQSIRERRMLWSLDVVELNKKIADLSDQDRMLADMNRCGLVDPDIFISQSNELARQLRAAKQEKERLLADGDDDVIPKTQELLETLDTQHGLRPQILPPNFLGLPRESVMKCLSRMMGNCHVRFLGEKAGVIPPT